MAHKSVCFDAQGFGQTAQEFETFKTGQHDLTLTLQTLDSLDLDLET